MHIMQTASKSYISRFFHSLRICNVLSTNDILIQLLLIAGLLIFEVYWIVSLINNQHGTVQHV